MTPTITPQAFVAKWQQATLRERASSQEHFIDLCRLIGHPTPAEADPAGKWFTFEAGATTPPSPAAAGEGGELRSHGVRAGWADVWKMGHFAWEYKGQHANLDKAYAQLLQYRESLLNPPLLIVSDMQRIVIHTNFTNTAKQTHNLALEDLLEPARLDLLRQAFTDPDALRPSQTPQQVTEKAAQEFGRLAELLRRYGNDPHATAHFLIRLLFCLYAEDANILPGGLFTRLVTQPATTGVLTGQLRQLFAAMAAGGAFGADVIPHVDGGLFDDDAALDLDSESRRILAEVSRLDWSAIKPSILGTLFERSLDPGKRSQLGAHYTGEEDILLIVEPVLMAPLRRRWAEVKAEVKAKAEKRDLIAGSRPSPQEDPATGQDRGGVVRPAARLPRGAGRDPGVGRGVRQRQFPLRQPAAAVGPGEGGHYPGGGVGRQPGLPHGLAEAVARHRDQPVRVRAGADDDLDRLHPMVAGQRFRIAGGADPEAAGSDPADGRDYGGDRCGVGKPVEPEWPEADVIVGNPPFLGVQKMRSELGDKYVEDLRALYAGRVPGGADLVSYWFEKARAQIEAGKAKRAGLLATQAIRGGANRKVLERIKETGDIFWAWSDRPWVLDGAAVHVSMVGFDNGTEKQRSLNGAAVAVINPDLTSALNLTTAQRLQENVGVCFEGVKKYGAFDIRRGCGAKTAAVCRKPKR